MSPGPPPASSHCPYRSIQTPNPHLRCPTDPPRWPSMNRALAHTDFAPISGPRHCRRLALHLSHRIHMQLDPPLLKSQFKWPPLQEAIPVRSATASPFSSFCFFLSLFPSVMSSRISLCTCLLSASSTGMGAPLELRSYLSGSLMCLEWRPACPSGTNHSPTQGLWH